MTSEFSRPVQADMIGERPRKVAIEADADERVALAKRFALIAVEALTGDFALSRDGGGVIAQGHVRACVIQACAATDEALPVTIDETVTLRFAEEITGEGEIELEPDALDTLPIANGIIDLGEATAETMALALDPFARKPGAGEVLRAAGVVGEDEVRPTSGLAGLKGLLGDA